MKCKTAHLKRLIAIIIVVIVCFNFQLLETKEVNAVCSWGEPYTNHIDPFTCYLRIPFQLNENDTLNFAREINETEILEVNFWSPLLTRNRWDINFVPRSIFSKFSNLRSFSLPGRIENVCQNDFINASNLVELSIGNQLKVIPEHVFSSMTKLELLDLSANKIKSIQHNGFTGLNNLRTLKLTRNHLVKLPANTFNGTQALEVLLLNNNQLESIEGGAFKLTHLKHLDLSYNKLSQLSNHIFIDCNQLEYLDLKSNRLTGIKHAIYHLHQLNTLNMDNNQIGDINLRRLSELCHLENLSIENNRKALNDNIFVDNNNNNNNSSSQTTFNGSKKPVLKNLYLSGNTIKNREILVRLWSLGLHSHLQKLYIDDNAFEFIDFYPISAFTQLEEINLGRNYWKCDWLEQTIQRLEADGIEVNLFSSHFPSSSSVKHVNFIQCVWNNKILCFVMLFNHPVILNVFVWTSLLSRFNLILFFISSNPIVFWISLFGNIYDE